MVDQANFGFLAKRLVLTELIGPAVEDIDGGCLVSGADLWLGLWEPECIEDPEQLIRETQQAAAETGRKWAGALLLTPPEKESSPAVAELAEALFLYGYPQLDEDEAKCPTLVKVLGKPDLSKAGSPAQLADADWGDSEVAQLVAQALKEEDRTSSPDWFDRARTEKKLHVQLCRSNEQPAGFICVQPAGLAGRVMALWVRPEYRESGVGTALVAEALSQSAGRQELIFTVWNTRKGTFRYYFDKLGFADQLTAMYFFSETRVRS